MTDNVTIVLRSSCKVSYICVRFEPELEFLDIISVKSTMSNLMKIRPMGAVLMDTERQADERTDIAKVIIAFRYCTNAPKTRKLCRFYNKNKRNVFIPRTIPT